MVCDPTVTSNECRSCNTVLSACIVPSAMSKGTDTAALIVCRAKNFFIHACVDEILSPSSMDTETRREEGHDAEPPTRQTHRNTPRMLFQQLCVSVRATAACNAQRSVMPGESGLGPHGWVARADSDIEMPCTMLRQ